MRGLNEGCSLTHSITVQNEVDVRKLAFLVPGSNLNPWGGPADKDERKLN